MSPSDDEVKKALESISRYNATHAEDVKQEQLRTFDRRLRTVRWITWGFLVLYTVAMVVCAVYFFNTGKVKTMILTAAIFVAVNGNVVLIKLWYWTVNTKLNLQKDMKELQLQIAELVASERRDET